MVKAMNLIKQKLEKEKNQKFEVRSENISTISTQGGKMDKRGFRTAEVS